MYIDNPERYYKHRELRIAFICKAENLYYYKGRIGKPISIDIKYAVRTLKGKLNNYPKIYTETSTWFAPEDTDISYSYINSFKFEGMIDSGMLVPLSSADKESPILISQFISYIRKAKTLSGDKIVGYVVYDHIYGIPYMVSIDDGNVKCSPIYPTSIEIPSITNVDNVVLIDGKAINMKDPINIKTPSKGNKGKKVVNESTVTVGISDFMTLVAKVEHLARKIEEQDD